MKIITKFKEYLFDKKQRKQRKQKGFSDSDCWGLNYWLGDTFPKMIRNLRDMKNGYPMCKFEDVDNFPKDWLELETNKMNEVFKNQHYDTSDELFNKWYLILTRIAYCLEQTNDELVKIANEYEDEYNKQVWGNLSFKNALIPIKLGDNTNAYKLNTNEPDDEIRKKYFEKEDEIAKYRDDMKNEAFDLLKKYFWDLWD